MNSVYLTAGERWYRAARLPRPDRWTSADRISPEPGRGYVELGELCRVHRGQVTGGNATGSCRWHNRIAGADAVSRGYPGPRTIRRRREAA